MYYKHHTKGLIVSSQIEGNDSRRVNIFTENFGFLNARVQGGRSMHSKLRSGCQDFSMGDFSLVHGKSGWRLVSARAEKNFFEIFRNNPVKLKIVFIVLSLIKKLIAEENKTSVFSIVLKFFDFLIKAGEQDIMLAECLTLMRILHSLGYMRYDPELVVPISSTEISVKDLEMIAPRRSKIVKLINESLKAT